MFRTVVDAIQLDALGVVAGFHASNKTGHQGGAVAALASAFLWGTKQRKVNDDRRWKKRAAVCAGEAQNVFKVR